jgi:hypothetical protein
MVKVCAPSPELLEKIKHATPPARFPRGYFDPLAMPTRQLLDKGLSLPQAANFFIEHGALQPRERRHYAAAMAGRISRLKREKVDAGAKHAWSANLFYDSTHLVLAGERKAVCGASATVWTPEISESNRCARCIGIMRKHGIRDDAV